MNTICINTAALLRYAHMVKHAPLWYLYAFSNESRGVQKEEEKWAYAIISIQDSIVRRVRFRSLTTRKISRRALSLGLGQLRRGDLATCTKTPRAGMTSVLNLFFASRSVSTTNCSSLLCLSASRHPGHWTRRTSPTQAQRQVMLRAPCNHSQ